MLDYAPKYLPYVRKSVNKFIYYLTYTIAASASVSVST